MIGLAFTTYVGGRAVTEFPKNLLLDDLKLGQVISNDLIYWHLEEVYHLNIQQHLVYLQHILPGMLKDVWCWRNTKGETGITKEAFVCINYNILLRFVS